MGRTPCCSKLGLNKGPWTPEEDILLIKYINTHGEGGWTKLPKKAGLLRCGKSCRLRWMNYLRPDVKRGYILPEEEDLILRLHRLLGNRWSLIAGRIPGRTDNEIKNYWNTHLSKQLISQGIDPRTHKPLAPESMQPPPKKPCYDREQQNRHPPPPPEFPITVVDQNPADFTCLGAIQYPVMNIVQAPTYVFHDQMTTVPLLHQTLFDNTGLSSNLSNPNHIYGFDGFDLQMNLNPNHSSVENYSGLDYQNYYVQEAQSDHTKLLECSENYELVSGIDQEVGCSFFGGLNSSEQLLLQSVPHGNECTIAGWPSFSAEIALLNYGQEMNSTSFQSQQQ